MQQIDNRNGKFEAPSIQDETSLSYFLSQEDVGDLIAAVETLDLDESSEFVLFGTLRRSWSNVLHS